MLTRNQSGKLETKRFPRGHRSDTNINLIYDATRKKHRTFSICYSVFSTGVEFEYCSFWVPKRGRAGDVS